MVVRTDNVPPQAHALEDLVPSWSYYLEAGASLLEEIDHGQGLS